MPKTKQQAASGNRQSGTLPGIAPPGTPPVSLTLEKNLYKIADAIQIPLTCKAGVVSGAGTIKITISEDLTIPVPVKAIKLFQKEQVGVVFHVKGDLHLIVSYYAKSLTAALFVIDASKVEGNLTDIIGGTLGLKEVVALVKAGVVSSYAYKGQWSKLDLA